MEPHKLLPSVVNQLIAVYQMRERLVNGRFRTLKLRLESDLPIGGGGGVGSLREEEEGMEKVITAKCYSTITVSSNSRLVGRYSRLGHNSLV